jgi:hypothetical protein
MQGGGLGPGVDLGLQCGQAKLGQRDPLLPADDHEARCIREHSGAFPTNCKLTACYQLLQRFKVGPLPRPVIVDASNPLISLPLIVARLILPAYN